MSTKAEIYQDLALIFGCLDLGLALAAGVVWVSMNLSRDTKVPSLVKPVPTLPLIAPPIFFPATETAKSLPARPTLRPTVRPSFAPSRLPNTETPSPSPTAEALPFTLGEISLTQPLTVAMPNNTEILIHPLPNLRPDGIDDNLISEFQDYLKTDPSSWSNMLALKTDLPGVTWMFGHSNSIKGVPLPWDWLAKWNLDDLLATKPRLYLQGSVPETLQLIYATDVSWEVTSPNQHPENFGQQTGGAFVRTDQMGIPDPVRTALHDSGGFIVDTCDGDLVPTRLSTTGHFYFTSQRISAWVLTKQP